MSTLISKASLLLVPSVYEDGTLYNVLPSGNKAPDETGNHNGYDQTRADFTFSRGSNLAATRVNANGLIEKGRENLLTYSNTFSDSDWGKGSSITLTSGQSGYDGTNNAWLLSKGSVQYPSLGQQVSNSGVKTLSVYAKANATSNLCLFVSSSPSNFYQDFDLSNGTLGAGSNGVIATNIDSVGDGWYRCSVVFNGATTSADIFPDTISGANAGSIYIQNAQLENGLVATDYIETGSVSGTAGVLENTPRIDYSSGAGALLLEPQRTNLITNSEYFGTWSIAQMSLEHNYATSPEGVQNATRLIENTAVGTAHSVNLPTTTTQAVHAFSVYAKPNGRDYIYMYVGNGPGQGTIIDIANGVKGSNVGSSPNDTIIEDAGNGWYKCTILFNGIAASVTPAIGLAHTSSSFTYTGDGTSGVLIYGAQLEAASHVSSYVPTYGSAATRGADSCSVTGVSDVIGQTEGTLFVEFMTPETNSYFIHSVSDGTNNNKVQIEYNTTSDTLIGIVRVSGVTEVSISATGMTPNTRYKAAIAYKANDFVFYVNGTQKGTDTSGSVPSSMSVIHLGSQVGTFFESGEVYNATLFNERLSNTELATLTTL